MVYINNIPFGNKEFPNHEAIYEFDVNDLHDDLNTVAVKFEDNRDITTLLFASVYLDDKKPNADRQLYIPYLPYARMDREINNQIFSLKYFSSILNGMDFDAVYVLDPHSAEAGKHIKFKEIELANYVRQTCEEFKPDLLFFPDSGAYEKYSEVLESINIPMFRGLKQRDLNNKGHIIGYELDTMGNNIEGKRVLIVDDICCKGGTAYHAAIKLKEAGVSTVGFWVAHCEDSIFLGEVLKTPYIDKVFTTDSLISKLSIIKVQ